MNEKRGLSVIYISKSSSISSLMKLMYPAEIINLPTREALSVIMVIKGGEEEEEGATVNFRSAFFIISSDWFRKKVP